MWMACVERFAWSLRWLNLALNGHQKSANDRKKIYISVFETHPQTYEMIKIQNNYFEQMKELYNFVLIFIVNCDSNDYN